MTNKRSVYPIQYYVMALLIVSILYIPCAGQGTQILISQFDENGFTTTDSASTAVFRTAEVSAGNFFVIRDYYRSGKLKMMAQCREYNPTLVPHGKTLWYHESGTIAAVRWFNDDDKTGTYRSYYESGKKMAEKRYVGDVEKYQHYWSEAGEDLFTGRACTMEASTTGKDRHFIVVNDDSVFTAEFIIPNGTSDSVYFKTEKPASYKGGLENMAKYLAKSMKYPPSAIHSGIQGSVYTQFVVDEKGAIQNPKVLRGLSDACDAEALRVIKKMPAWDPAVHNGRPVKMRYVLPLKFKLAY